MTEIRWHGRGGLGAFTAARLLGCAVSLYEGKYALAFPSFGPERRGARSSRSPVSTTSPSRTAARSSSATSRSFWMTRCSVIPCATA